MASENRRTAKPQSNENDSLASAWSLRWERLAATIGAPYDHGIQVAPALDTFGLEPIARVLRRMAQGMIVHLRQANARIAFDLAEVGGLLVMRRKETAPVRRAH